jgi:hypothetical protein
MTEETRKGSELAARSRLPPFLREPAMPGLILMGALIAAGFLILLLTWAGAAGTLYVPLQMPHIVSGGLGGLALIGLGGGLLYLQRGRRDDATHRRLTDELIDEAAALIAIEPEIRRRLAPKRAGARRKR